MRLPAADEACPPTDSGLPLPASVAAEFAAGRAAPPQPAGGSAAVRAAAAGYWDRRGDPTAPHEVLLAPGPVPLLRGVLAATGAELLLPRPCAPWYLAAAGERGGRCRLLPTPAECGGVPDPVALLESLRRTDGAGHPPRVLVLAVADDPTGTLAPPELVHEVCEAAAAADLLVVSDETFRDLTHDPLTVVPSPTELIPERTVTVCDLASWLLPGGPPAAMARFPAARPAPAGAADQPAPPLAAVRAALESAGAVLPGGSGAAAAAALGEPPGTAERLAAAVRLHGAVARAAHAVLVEHGVLCLPPTAGFHLYADFTAAGAALAARGVGDSAELARRLPGALAGHRLGEPADLARVRIAVPALYGRDPAQRAEAAASADPLRVRHVADALAALATAVAGLTGW